MGPHPHIEHLRRFFAYSHLPPHLQPASRPFAETLDKVLAQDGASEEVYGALEELADTIKSDPDTQGNIEIPFALGKISEAQDAFVEGDDVGGVRLLLEAKDCAVRARL